MNPRIKRVKANPDYTLTLLFRNNERKAFDVRPYLELGFFKELKDVSYFIQARPFMGAVAWPHGQDFCPDTLFEESIPLD